MLHGPGTLLMRSIRSDALSRRAHFLRLGAVLFILVMLIAAHADSGAMGAAAPGLMFFRGVSFLGVALISLAAAGHFCTAITEEKEEGTLGLLLLADISPLSILLGKSTNRILSAWLLLMAMLPFSLLSLTLGGLTAAQVISSLLALASYLFLVANLALLVSVLVNRTSEAVSVTTLFVLLLLSSPFLVELTQIWLVHVRAIPPRGWQEAQLQSTVELLKEVSILHEIERTFQIGAQISFPSAQFLWSLFLGIVCFGLAWLRFRRIVWVQDASSSADRASFGTGWRVPRSVSRSWSAALVWKDFHFIAGGWPLFVIKSLTFVTVIPLCLWFKDDVRLLSGMEAMTFLQQAMCCVLAIEVLACASQLYQVERKWGTLCSLLQLPRSIARISWAKVAGCALGSCPTLLAFVILWFLPIRQQLDPSLRQMEIAQGEYEVLIVGICGLILLSQMTVLCSLIVRWGALPLAIAACLIFAVTAGPFLAGSMALLGWSRGPGQINLMPLFYVTLVGSFGLQWEIGRRVALAGGK